MGAGEVGGLQFTDNDDDVRIEDKGVKLNDFSIFCFNLTSCS